MLHLCFARTYTLYVCRNTICTFLSISIRSSLMILSFKCSMCLYWFSMYPFYLLLRKLCYNIVLWVMVLSVSQWSFVKFCFTYFQSILQDELLFKRGKIYRKHRLYSGCWNGLEAMALWSQWALTAQIWISTHHFPLEKLERFRQMEECRSRQEHKVRQDMLTQKSKKVLRKGSQESA